jgi:hypothetical protein
MHEDRTEGMALPVQSAAVALSSLVADIPTGVSLPERRVRTIRRHSTSLTRARSIAEAIFSTAEGPPPAGRLIWVVDELETFLDKAGWRAGGIFKLALALVSLISRLLVLDPRPLPLLPLPNRVRALQALERSVLNAPLVAVKAILCIIYYEHADAARDAGYTGACAEKAAR